ncbi:oligosaccharide flippase family protein [Actinobacillus genomosp. 2]|uniref:oligosaccharide flippase family protein n=1 Tax=Actinobacillus genomosp. 2 TaxID=230709 RepID=UPI0024426CD0|nr:oligosaccharide flippase family protein [Actinobacillus genomosp. 2]WGE31938.1 oligosaccharide flippase family protein [Actinobacillus genomosp. 2]
MNKNLVNNSIMSFLLTISNFIFPLITFTYAARILQPDNMGKFAFSLSVVDYLSLFATFGVVGYGVRACAEVRNNKEELTKTVQEILFINIFLAIIAYLVIFLLISYQHEFREDILLFLIMSSCIIFNVIGIEWLYKSLDEYRYITVRSILLKIISLIMVLCFVKEKDDYLLFALFFVLPICLSSLLNIINSRKILLFKLFKLDLLKHIKPMFILFLVTLSYTLYANVNDVLLATVTNTEQVGYYSVAFKIKGALLAFITSASMVFLPRLTEYIKNNQDAEFVSLLRKSFDLIFFLAVPITLFFFLYARETMFLLFGEKYNASILLLKVMIWSVFFGSLNSILSVQILLPLKKDKQYLFSILSGGCISLLINFVFLEELQSLSASIAVLAAEVTILIIQIIILREYFIKIFSVLNYLKVIVSALFAICFVDWISVNFITEVNFLIGYIMSILLFSILYLAFLFLSKERFFNEVVLYLKSRFV